VPVDAALSQRPSPRRRHGDHPVLPGIVNGAPPRGLRRVLAPIVTLTIGLVAAAACSNGGGGESTAPGTLPPIATTAPPTTGAPSTTVATRYEVRAGDTLSAIADAHSVTVDAVLAANPEIASADDIHDGQFIQIPAPASVTSLTVDQ